MRFSPPKRAPAKLPGAGHRHFGFLLVPTYCIFIGMAAGCWAQMSAAQPVGAQQGTTPGLHPRPQADATAAEGKDAKNSNSQTSTLPKDVSGAYEFDRLNESIEVDVDRNKLSGYITRLGDAETDNNIPLTFFFDHASVQGSQLQFQTRVVHGIWYSFRGTIVRGNGQTRNDEGYYVLHGVLKEHHPQDTQEKSADETIVRRTVNFKSLAQ